jgi:molybdopterin-synthase adenylyltransferase
MTGFSYAEMTGRNIGFVSQVEQNSLHDGTALVVGSGGMGGACIATLARAGVGHLIVADIDSFDVANLNRQVFAFADTLGLPKAEATAMILRRINPEIGLTVLGAEWPDQIDAMISRSGVVVNGTDDLGASLLLYRRARALGRTVIDAYAAPLPSVYVTQPRDQPHEARLRYPTIGTDWDKITPDQRRAALLAEATHVVLHSSSRCHVDMALVAQVMAGSRPRMSFAPMVITTGQLMAYEALNALLGRPRGADNRGWFLNPHRGRVERPWPAPIAALMRPFVARALAKVAG